MAAHGQVFSLTAGSSTLYGASGGSVNVYLPHSILSASLGQFDGNFQGGLTDRFSDWQLGTSQIFLSTIGGGISAPLVGAEYQRGSLTLFAGGLGDAYSVPYAFGDSIRYGAAGFAFRREISGRLRWDSVGLLSKKSSLLESLSYRSDRYQLAATGGILQNAPFLNASGTARTQYFGANVTAQTILFNGKRYAVTSESLLAHADGFSANATAIQAQQPGWTIGAAWRTFQASYFVSGNTRVTVFTGTEPWRHFSLIESASFAGSQHSFGIGAAYHSNLLNVSVQHEELFFIPVGWQRVLAASLTVHLGNATIGAAIDRLTDGEILYGAQVGDYLGEPANDSQRSARLSGHLLAGICRDQSGKRVEGCALKIGNDEVYSDAEGNFFTRSRKITAALACLPNDFASPGQWKIVQCPSSIQENLPAVVLVHRF